MFQLFIVLFLFFHFSTMMELHSNEATSFMTDKYLNDSVAFSSSHSIKVFCKDTTANETENDIVVFVNIYCNGTNVLDDNSLQTLGSYINGSFDVHSAITLEQCQVNSSFVDVNGNVAQMNVFVYISLMPCTNQTLKNYSFGIDCSDGNWIFVKDVIMTEKGENISLYYCQHFGKQMFNTSTESTENSVINLQWEFDCMFNVRGIIINDKKEHTVRLLDLFYELCISKSVITDNDDRYIHCKERQNGSDTCKVCEDGWFGELCEARCPIKCLLKSCDKSFGTCSWCELGWYGDKCEYQCFDNCNACFENSSCLLCSNGYYGYNCNQTCPEDCTSCSRDGQTCTSCKAFNNFGDDCKCTINECKKFGQRLQCYECKKPGWYASSYGCCPCSKQCINSQCHITTGDCLNGCNERFYGSKCNLNCSPVCINGSCTSSTVDCKYNCSLVFPYCDKCSYDLFNENFKCQRCVDGYFKPSMFSVIGEDYSFLNNFCHPCKHCKNDRCDGSSGLCKEGCKQHGRYNSQYFINGEKYCILECSTCFEKKCDHLTGSCMESCIDGYHGSDCRLECSEFCPNNTCDMLTGHCLGCYMGQYGPYCNKTCGHCKDGGCYQYTGICKGGCLQGYYGEKCDEYCSSCIGADCNLNGSCIHGCIPGYYGSNCNFTCNDNCFICHPVSGNCLTFNQTDIGVSYDMLTTPCVFGKYGAICERPCGQGCKRRGKQVMCDKLTGYCHDCLGGFHGIPCDKKCNKTCNDLMCDRNGECTRGCAYRWQGKYCQYYFPETVFEQISGILFGVMCMLVLVVGVLCVIRKKRNLKKTFTMTNEKVAIHMSKEKITYV